MAKQEAEDKEGSNKQKLAERKREVFKKARGLAKPFAPNRKKVLLITSAILVSTVIIFLSVFALLIYRFHSDSDLVYRVARIIPYPAARINDQFVTYGEYLFELRPLKHFYEKSGASMEGGDQYLRNRSSSIDFSTPEGQEQLIGLQKAALEEANKSVMVRQLAEEHNITVTEAELEAAIAQEIEKNGGEKKFTEAINFVYGWSLEDFRDKLEVQLLQQKLAPLLSDEQRAIAEDVLARARKGEDFSKLARQFSEDPGSKDIGGDLGLRGKGFFVPAFEEAATKLEPGEISGIIETEFGFHIIKGIEKEGEEFKVAHILIQYQSMDAVVQEKLSNSDVKRYIEL
jgi:hypothetical protein